ncbi:MAG: hypothetical protein K9G64_08735 [Bacteroidia bacterium]|nr:hypothetical protein [Bacteroidia bacterium]
MKKNSYTKIPKILYVVIFFTFFGYLLNILGLSSLISPFVNRAIFEGDFGKLDKARGLVGFYPEQSRIPEQLGFIYFTLLLINRSNNKLLVILLLAGLLSFAGQFFFTIGIIFTAIFISFFLNTFITNSVKLKHLFIFFFIFILITTLYTYLPNLINILITEFHFPSRGLDAVRIFLLEGSTGFSGDAGLITKLTGIMAALATLISNPFNFEFGSIFSNQLELNIGSTYFKIQNSFFGNIRSVFFDRVFSAFGLVIIDFGIIGLLAIIMYFRVLFQTIINKKINILMFLIALFYFLISVFIKIPLANPTLWVIPTLIYFLTVENNINAI